MRGPTTRRHSTRSCWRNDICPSRSKSRRTSVFIGNKIRVKFSKNGNLENFQRAHGGCQCRDLHFQKNASKLRRPLDTVDLEEPPDSCERPNRTFSMKRFKGQLWRHISRSNNEKTLAENCAERMKFVPPDLRAGQYGFHWHDEPSRMQQGRAPWLLLILVPPFFQVNASKLRRPLDTVDLEELPIRMSFQEHLCVGFLVKAKQTSGNCSLTILIGVPFLIDNDSWLQRQEIWEQRRLKASHHNHCKAFGQRSKERILKQFWCPQRFLPNTVTEKRVRRQQYRLCLAVAEHQILGGKKILMWVTESRMIWWL